ncbi:hypothetical protein NC652_020844 [Populus alba x Populus x berolinensis]|nr:hypothetical protein NC652_020844 [Populus alba x Populus x berolinensis]
MLGLFLHRFFKVHQACTQILNSFTLRLTGGFLMTCSCSGAITQSGMFLRVLQVFFFLNQGAASMAGREVSVLREA